jgi:VanZ family protein
MFPVFSREYMSTERRPSLGFIACLLLWIGLLVFGLWPFDFLPGNKVRWVGNGPGIIFDHYGQVYSLDRWSLQPSHAQGPRKFSFEFWLTPQAGYETFSAVFCVCTSKGRTDLMVAESGPDLVVVGHFRKRDGTSALHYLWYDGAAMTGERRFLTMTSGPEGTVLYLDGKPLQPDRYRDLLPENYSGQFFIGHSPSGEQGWRGIVLGLALYDRVLSAQEVAIHYRLWQESDIDPLKNARALYTFEEEPGNVIRNRAAASSPDLLIPQTFTRFRPEWLDFPHPLKRSDIRDAIVNIMGFIPFGFCLFLYLRITRDFSPARALWCAVLIGGLTSLAIEICQVFLPTRDSSALDLINNIIGSLAGSMLGRVASRRRHRLFDTAVAGDQSE